MPLLLDESRALSGRVPEHTLYAKVLDAAGEPLSVHEALALINQILDEVLAEQEGDFGLVGVKVTVALGIEAEVPSGAPDHAVRTVTENSRTLKFTSQGFEKEQDGAVRSRPVHRDGAERIGPGVRGGGHLARGDTRGRGARGDGPRFGRPARCEGRRRRGGR